MNTVIITRKPEAYPHYDTYTAYEFLVISAELLRNMEMVLIDERMSARKLRKIRNRMNAFNIVEIDMLPEDVVDVAESNVVRLPTGNVYVNRFKLRPVESFAIATGEASVIDATIIRLGEEVCTVLSDIKYDPAKGGGELLNSILELMFQGLGIHDTKTMREKILTCAMARYNSRINMTKHIRQARDAMMDAEIMRAAEALRGVVHKRVYVVGLERVMKAKGFLQNPSPVRYFKTKQELAEHLASKLPDTVEIRKRNALKFKVCCELNEAELLRLATDVNKQTEFVSKFC